MMSFSVYAPLLCRIFICNYTITNFHHICKNSGMQLCLELNNQRNVLQNVHSSVSITAILKSALTTVFFFHLHPEDPSASVWLSLTSSHSHDLDTDTVLTFHMPQTKTLHISEVNKDNLSTAEEDVLLRFQHAKQKMNLASDFMDLCETVDC